MTFFITAPTYLHMTSVAVHPALFMILYRINEGVFIRLFRHANNSIKVYEHRFSSVWVFSRIIAHLANLAHLFFS